MDDFFFNDKNFHDFFIRADEMYLRPSRNVRLIIHRFHEVFLDKFQRVYKLAKSRRNFYPSKKHFISLLM